MKSKKLSPLAVYLVCAAAIVLLAAALSAYMDRFHLSV